MGRREFVLVFFGGLGNVYYREIDGIFIFPGDFASAFRGTSTKGTVSSERVISIAEFRIVGRFQVTLSNEFAFGVSLVTCFSEYAEVMINCFPIFGMCTECAIDNDYRGMVMIGSWISRYA